MASLSLGGVNLDVTGLVAQLMQVESAPLSRLIAKESEYESQLSAFGRLKSALSSFQSSMKNLASPDKFEIYKTSTSEASTDRSFTATVNSDAASGVFSIDVLNLAKANKFGSSDSLSSKTDPIATTGNLDISDGNDSLSIDINGKSLTEIRDAINTAADTGDVGVSASIIQESATAFRLVLTASDTGLDNEITISSSGDAVTQLKLTETQTAQNATVLVDNAYTISSSSNTIEDAISGVTLNLLKQSTAAADLKIERDTDAVKATVNSFVSGFNTLLGTVNALKESGLEGDSITRSVLSSIRSEFNTSAGLSSSFNYLSEIGITSNAKTGELEIDSTKLDKAMSQDYEAISQLFANDNQGVAFRLEEKMDAYVSFDGIIKSREDGLNTRIDYNQNSQLNMQYRLEKIEARYLKEFSALDSIISQSNATSSYLTQQLANLPGVVR